MPYRPYRAFTPRQELVIDGIRRGLTNGEIAAELLVSESTVQGYIDRIVIQLRNPDDLPDRQAIFQYAWWRVWDAQLQRREAHLRALEDAALARATGAGHPDVHTRKSTRG